MSNEVAKTSSIIDSMSESWDLIDTLMGGTFAIRAAGEKYLPKWPNETSESYKKRLGTSTLYPALKRTVSILAAKPFSKALKLSDDVPSKIADWSDNIDLQGRNLQSFASDVFQSCMSHGISGVLVDYPQAIGVKTVADEKQLGVRPYFVHYEHNSILGFRSEKLNGVEVLTQLRLKEMALEPDGEFGEKSIEQVRVLYPGSWEIWRKNEKDGKWFRFDFGETSLKAIPFVPFYGLRTGFFKGESPLLELAHLNVEHYQGSSDQRTILHVARVPILTIVGADADTKIEVGSASAINLPLNASMSFVEHSGAAIEAGRQSLIDLEERMRQTGAELLVIRPGNVTATQVFGDNEANKCDLQRITENFEDALDQCLQYMADWIGERDGGSVELFKDFGVSNLSDASSQLLLSANTAGKISDVTFINELKRRNVLSQDIKAEEEQQRVSDQGPPLGVI